ncbi:MAG: protein kinase [Myxococcota bacterium]
MGHEFSGRPEPTIVREGEQVSDGPDPMIGQVLSGLYKVDRRIGEGGMGTVYMAVHIHLNKPFAVKVLSEKVAANKQAIDRLLMEAQTASSIDHDNIVDVVSFDTTDDGRVFLVMEMLEGVSLSDLVEEGPMRLERALPIIYQICQALEAAHARGIIHRDLKPENVFIVRKREADFVKVLDFGISKVKSAEAEQVRMTRTGQLVGTPLYMSPEQARGETDVDHRADIYALGVMLYEMLVGRPPFEGGNYFQLLWKHGNEVPEAPQRRRSDLPSGVDAAIMRALEKKPGDRFETMALFEAALVAAAPEVGVSPERLVSLPPAEPARRSVMPMVVAGAVVVILGIAGLLILRPDPESPPSPALAAQPPFAPSADVEVQEETPPVEIPLGMDLPATNALVHFASTPSGATVFRGDEELGTTPFETSLPLGVSITVRYQRAGFRAAEVDVVPEEGGRVEQRLRRRAAGAARMSDLPQPRMTL